MNIIPLVVAALAVLPVLGLLAWVWLAMERASDDLSTFTNFEGMHFEDF